MKVAASIFTVLGMVVNFFTGPIIFAIIGVCIGIGMLITLCNNYKSVALGIFGLLCTGLLGGIFYLCWNPEK